jgi:hypothetical protein
VPSTVGEGGGRPLKSKAMRKSGAWIAHQCLLPVTKTPSASFSFSKVHKSPDKLLWHRVAPGPNPALPTSRHNRASDDCDSADE